MARFACHVLYVVFAAYLSGCSSHSTAMAGPDAGLGEVGAICALLDEGLSEAEERVLDRELADAKKSAGRMVYNSSRLSLFAPEERQAEFREMAEKLRAGSVELEEACIGYDNERAVRVLAGIKEVCRGCHDMYCTPGG